jgi:hypothetical protein
MTGSVWYFSDINEYIVLSALHKDGKQVSE